MEDGSPLMVYSQQQRQALAARLPDTPVALGMSYGSPSLESAVDELLEQGWITSWCYRFIRNLCSTVAAVWDELGRILCQKTRDPRNFFFIRDYADDVDYIHALAASVRASFAVRRAGFTAALPIMASRSGMPSKGTPILSAVAIPPVSWFQPWGCRLTG